MALQELAILRIPNSNVYDVARAANAFAGLTLKELESSNKKISVKELSPNRYSVKWDQGMISYDRDIRQLEGLAEIGTIIRTVFEIALSSNS